MKKQKIIIADNNKYFREGLKRILLNIGNVKIVGEAQNGFMLLTLLEEQKVDIVFIDVMLGGMNGIDTLLLAREKFPHIRFIAFSSLENERYINKMIAAGANGYLSKSRDNYDLLHEITSSGDNRFFLSEGLKKYGLEFNVEIQKSYLNPKISVS